MCETKIVTIHFVCCFVTFYRIRGKLGSITQLSRSAGMLFAFIVNAFVDYDVQPYIFIIIPIVYLIKFIVLPNTPQHLLRKNKFEVGDIEFEVNGVGARCDMIECTLILILGSRTIVNFL